MKRNIVTPPFGIESYGKMGDQDLLIEETLICPSFYSIHFFMQAGTCMLILYEEVIGNELKAYIWGRSPSACGVPLPYKTPIRLPSHSLFDRV